MKVGRNDVCHCGSGKKYKKCCLAGDQAAEQSKTAKLLPRTIAHREIIDADSNDEEDSESGTPEPPDPKMDAIMARWEEFQEATEDVRRELFIKTLDDPELMDDEMAFEMLSQTYRSTIKSDQRDVWDNMVEQLQQRLPDVYAVSRKYYIGWQVENMIAGGRRDRVKSMIQEIANLATVDATLYLRIVDQLAYHGMLEELSEISHIAWPQVKVSDKIWGKSTFAEWGAECVLFERLEQAGVLNHEDNELIQKIGYYIEDLQLEHFSDYTKSISGRLDRTFLLDDFKMKDLRQRHIYDDEDDDDDDEKQGLTPKSKSDLSSLLNTFIDYARRIEGIPYTKVRLASANIYTYICGRLAGKLEPKQSVLESMRNPPKKAKQKQKLPTNFLCPDRDTLDRYLAELLHFMNPLQHQAAATLELIPTWLRFLKTKGLLEPKMQKSTLNELGKLQATLSKLFQSDRSDPAIADNVSRWTATAELSDAERD